MANRQAAFVRELGEPNPAGEILLEQLDGAALLYGPQARLGRPWRFLHPGIPLQQVRTKEELQVVHAQRTRRGLAADVRKDALRQLRQHEVLFRDR